MLRISAGVALMLMHSAAYAPAAWPRLVMPAPIARAAGSDSPPSHRRDFFDRVRGRWSGAGTLAGRPMHATYIWSESPAGAQLTVALYPPGGSAAVFEGTLLAPTDTRPGRWTDSQRADFAVTRLAFSVDSLVTAWGPDSSRGRSVYRVHAGDSLEVRDYRVNATTGAPTLFGRYVTRRDPGSDAR